MFERLYMRKIFVILIILAFTAVFSANNVKVNVKHVTVQLCCDPNMATTHAQKEFDINTNKSSLPGFYEIGNFENEIFGKKKCKNNSDENFVFFYFLRVFNSLLPTSINKFHFDKYYVNPYNTLEELHIYILNHTLLILFS